MSVFTEKVPGLMALLMDDFALSVEDAAAVFGNAGHESAGFETLQETKPTVSGSKGGYGWFQWTGPRRRAYEAYCKRNGLDPASDKANYSFLFVELKGPEQKAIPALRAAKTLNAKVKAFELAFERAGVKHYKLRNVWGARAREAYMAAPKPIPLPTWARPVTGSPDDEPRLAPTPEPEPAPPLPDGEPTLPPPPVERGIDGQALEALWFAILIVAGVAAFWLLTRG